MHRSTKTVLTIAVLTLLTTPAATATWMLAGSHEPDTHYDVSTWMFQEPAPPGVERVYFSAFVLMAAAGAVGVNPNVGALQTQIEVANSETLRALLGVWIDCNGDGYVGLAETAAKEYSAQLLLDDSVCPPANGPPNRWTPGEHNYNGWVSEYVPIARDVTLSGSNLNDDRVYPDDDARVWGDFGKPDEQSKQRSCAISPQPRGTWQSSGGVMNYVDCRGETVGIDLLGSMNGAFVLAGDPAGWTFSDDDDATTGALGAVSTFGEEDDSHSAAQVWDCSSPAVHSGDTFNSTPLGPTIPSNLQNERIYGPSPGVGNTQDPTIPGTLNHTIEGAYGLDNCDTSDDFGHDFYTGTCRAVGQGITAVYCWGEGDFNGVDPNNKRQANWNMRFDTVSRGTLPFNLIPGGSGFAGIPGDQAGVSWGGSEWTATSYWLSKPGFGTVRADISDPTSPSVDTAAAYWLSFYAYVGPTTTGRAFALPGNTGAYAAWACGENTSGIRQGFNCDVSKWNKNPDGTPLSPGGELENHELVVPGQTYNLRDIDCYDGSIGDTGIGVQPAFYGSEPCS